jgi:hypothetical protein
LTAESVEAQRKVRDLRERVERLRRALEEDEHKGGTKNYQIETDIKVTLEEKRQAIDAAERKIQELIAQKTAYSKFAVRRLRHGYANLGAVITTATQGIHTAMQQLVESIRYAKENMDALLERGVQEGDLLGDDERGEEEDLRQPSLELAADQGREAAPDQVPEPQSYDPMPYEPPVYDSVRGPPDDSPFPPE